MRDSRTNETSEERAPGRLDRLHRPGRIDVPERELDPPPVAAALRVLGTGRGAKAHLAIPSESVLEREPGDATRAVPAVLGGLAVGVEVAHREVELGIALDQEHAVGADAAAPIAQALDQALERL